MDKEINNRKCEVLLEGRSDFKSYRVFSGILLALRKGDEMSVLQVSGIKVEEHRGWRCGSTEEERFYPGMIMFLDKVKI